MASDITTDAVYIPAINFTEVAVDPTAPGSGHVLLYCKGGVWYARRSTGSPGVLGGTPPLTEHLLGVGDGSGLLSALPAGAEGAVPTRQADGSIAEVVPTASGGGDLQLIDEFVAADSTAASWTSAAIGTDWRNLMLFIHGRSDLAANLTEDLHLRFNGDTAGNYNSLYSYSSLSAAPLTDVFSATSNALVLDALPAATATASYANIIQCNIAGYRSPFYKAIEWRCIDMRDNTAGNSYVMFGGGLWRNAAAITSVTILLPSGGHFVTGTTISLYGLK